MLQEFSDIFGVFRFGKNSSLSSFLSKTPSDRKAHLLFFSGYLGATHHHLYQLVQLSRLQKKRNFHLHIVISDTIGGTKRHSDYSDELSDGEHFKKVEKLSNEVKSSLLSLGVDENRIHLYKFSNIWMQAFNRRKDLLLNFYQGLNEIPESALFIKDSLIKKYHLPPSSRYGVGYVVQKFAVLFFSSHIKEILDEVGDDTVIPVFGEPGVDIIENLYPLMLEKHVVSPLDNALTLVGIPTFGTNQSKTKTISIPRAGMSIHEIADITRKYEVSTEDIREIYRLFIENVTGKSFRNPDSKYLSFAEDLHDAFKKLIVKNTNSTEMTVVGQDEIEKIGSLLRSENVLQALALCDGDHSVTDIAKKLNKHTSNISTIIRQLKDVNLVEILPNGRPMKSKKSITIILK